MPPEKVAVVVSGTQGEPMSALSRVAVDNHKNLYLQPGDTVALSARIIPGNEKAIYRMMNHMARRGADAGLRLHESADARLRPRQRGRAEAGAESGPPALFRSRAWRIPPARAPRPTGRASAHSRARKTPLCSKPGDTLEIDHDGRAARRDGSPSAASASIPDRSTMWWRT